MCDIRGELRMIVPDHTSLLRSQLLLKEDSLIVFGWDSEAGLDLRGENDTVELVVCGS